MRQRKVVTSEHGRIRCWIKPLVDTRSLLIDPQCTVNIVDAEEFLHVEEFKTQSQVKLDHFVDGNWRRHDLAMFVPIFCEQERSFVLKFLVLHEPQLVGRCRVGVPGTPYRTRA